MTITTDALTAARAEALFTSPLSTGSHPGGSDVDDAIRAAVRAHGSVRGCAADVAAEYGDHPELAVPRMRWARAVVEHRYGSRRPYPDRRRRGWALVA
jgi:hypothetical protein